MPAAARQGDLTSHGGVVTTGAASVYIEGQPAARVGDLHQCPMMNPGPSPHCGGPIIKGEDSVLIEARPAAVLGSFCCCAGPMDVISSGASGVIIGSLFSKPKDMTLLISHMEHARRQALNNSTITKGHFLDLQFVDNQGNKLLPTGFQLRDSDGVSHDGQLPVSGRLLHRRLLNAGNCHIALVSVNKLAWFSALDSLQDSNIGHAAKLSPLREARLGDAVVLQVEFSAFIQNKAVEIQIYLQRQDNQTQYLTRLQGKLQNNVLRIPWRIQFSRVDFPVAGLFFTVSSGADVFKSAVLSLPHQIDMVLHGRQDLAGKKVYFKYQDGGYAYQHLDRQSEYHSNSGPGGEYRLYIPGDQLMYAE